MEAQQVLSFILTNCANQLMIISLWQTLSRQNVGAHGISLEGCSSSDQSSKVPTSSDFTNDEESATKSEGNKYEDVDLFDTSLWEAPKGNELYAKALQDIREGKSNVALMAFQLWRSEDAQRLCDTFFKMEHERYSQYEQQ